MRLGRAEGIREFRWGRVRRAGVRAELRMKSGRQARGSGDEGNADNRASERRELRGREIHWPVAGVNRRRERDFRHCAHQGFGRLCLTAPYLGKYTVAASEMRPGDDDLYMMPAGPLLRSAIDARRRCHRVRHTCASVAANLFTGLCGRCSGSSRHRPPRSCRREGAGGRTHCGRRHPGRAFRSGRQNRESGDRAPEARPASGRAPSPSAAGRRAS